MSIYNKVFLVDDDSITNMLNEKIIIKHDIANSVSTFTDGYLALRQLKENALISSEKNIPDIIFLDINMPEINGWKFIEELLSIDAIDFNKCKVIMLSSSIDIIDIQKSISFSVISNFITKPLTPDKLKSLHAKEKTYFLFEE